MEKTAVCPECGQMVAFNIQEKDTYELTQKDLEKNALLACDCPAARKARAVEAQIAEAKDNIIELCGVRAVQHDMTQISSEDVINILNKCVDMVATDDIFNATICVSGHGVVKIKKGSKGKITVQRSVGFTEQLDATQKQ